MKYLIMKCDELSDQYECDANRKPIAMTNDWEEWYTNTKPNFVFEVYQYNEKKNRFTLIKEYTTPMEYGMALAYYASAQDDFPTCIKKFPNLTRHDVIPSEVYERAIKGEDYDDWLNNCGYLTWEENGILYSYSEYSDNYISTCY